MKRIVYILALCCLTGCYSGEGCAPRPKLTPAQSDKQALDIYAAIVNASQTNWTVTITQRTNTP